MVSHISLGDALRVLIERVALLYGYEVPMFLLRLMWAVLLTLAGRPPRPSGDGVAGTGAKWLVATLLLAVSYVEGRGHPLEQGTFTAHVADCACE
jgi:hypothetical protein